MLFAVAGCAGVETQTSATTDLVASPSTVGAMVLPVPRPATSSTTFDLRRLAPVVAYLEAVTPSTVTAAVWRTTNQCAYAELIRQIWQRDAEWAITVAWRESRCQPGARHPEGASGIFQMMLPLHRRLFETVGCTAVQWADPTCNIRAAWLLYEGAGRQPWRL